MTDQNFSRRNFIKGSTGLVSCTWLCLSLSAIGAAARGASAAGADRDKFKILNASEAHVVAAVAEQIFPSDGTPGAREAGVVYFIDQVLHDQQAHVAGLIKQGVVDLQGRAAKYNVKSFADLPDDTQISLLTEIEDTPFFGVLRFLTVCGMFSKPSYGGNQNKVGWQLIDFDERAVWQPPFGYYDAQAMEAKS